MQKRLPLLIGTLCLIGILSWLLFNFFGVQALFTDRIVDEEVLALSSDSDEATTESSILLSSGIFVQGDSTYTISGNALVAKRMALASLHLPIFR